MSYAPPARSAAATSVVSANSCSVARGFYLRLTGGGQRRKKQAIIALARKILVRARPCYVPKTLARSTSVCAAKEERQAGQRRIASRRHSAPQRLMPKPKP
jgi:hypothetical protein